MQGWLQMVPFYLSTNQHSTVQFVPDCLHGLLPGPFLLSYLVFDFIFSFLGRALD